MDAECSRSNSGVSVATSGRMWVEGSRFQSDPLLLCTVPVLRHSILMYSTTLCNRIETEGLASASGLTSDTSGTLQRSAARDRRATPSRVALAAPRARSELSAALNSLRACLSPHLLLSSRGAPRLLVTHSHTLSLSFVRRRRATPPASLMRLADAPHRTHSRYARVHRRAGRCALRSSGSVHLGAACTVCTVQYDFPRRGGSLLAILLQKSSSKSIIQYCIWNSKRKISYAYSLLRWTILYVVYIVLYSLVSCTVYEYVL